MLFRSGSHKYLVGGTTELTALAAGYAYRIVTVGNTSWSSYGAPSNAAAGDIFTATANGSNSGTGTCNLVGVCILDNDATPAAGYMSIEYSVGDSSAVYASYISKKWIRDWSGMTYSNYSPSNSGGNIQSGENFYPVNFFTDEGTVTWSGAEVINGASAQNGSLQLAQVDKITS